jgi:Fe-S-cluster containining protein
MKKIYREIIRTLNEELCAKYCPGCTDDCCSGRLNPRIRNISPFSGIKVIKPGTDTRRIREGFILEKGFLFYKKFYLFRKCPHYIDNKCAIYGSPERPDDCRLYPLYISHPFGLKFFHPFINAEGSCRIFRIKENKEKVRDIANELGLDVFFHR